MGPISTYTTIAFQIKRVRHETAAEYYFTALLIMGNSMTFKKGLHNKQLVMRTGRATNIFANLNGSAVEEAAIEVHVASWAHRDIIALSENTQLVGPGVVSL